MQREKRRKKEKKKEGGRRKRKEERRKERRKEVEGKKEKASNMAPMKGSKTPQYQRGKKDKIEGTNKSTTGAQPTQITDIKEFFQQLQPQPQSPHVIQVLQTS